MDSLSSNIQIPFPSNQEAEIAYRSLSVDKEPKRGGVCRTITCTSNILNVHFEAKEARMLRVSMNSFFEHLKLVVETIERFGPPR